MIRILSFGAGMQSSAILLMAIRGDFKLDHAIFADTGWESKDVYEYIDYISPMAKSAGIQFHHVSKGDLRRDILDRQVVGGTGRFASMPLFVKRASILPGGGQIPRQCSSEYKIEPIHARIREILELRPRQWWPRVPVVEKFYGFSAEEQRRKERLLSNTAPKMKWAIHRFPLIKRNMTRLDCLAWIESKGFRRPPTSSCIGCPYHSDAFWSEMKAERSEEFSDAVEFDLGIRKLRDLHSDAFLHASRRPLSGVRFDVDRTPDMFGEECFGLCGT